MNVSLDPNKTLDILSKIKIHYLTLILTFVSSVNLWFLCIYFLNKDLLNNGIGITLLVSVSLATIWCILIAIPTVRNMMISSEKITGKSDDTILDDGISIINLFILIRVVIVHSVFIFITYIFNFRFKGLVISSFIYAAIYYLLIQFAAFDLISKKFKKSSKNT
ncbi:hypothetical protein PG911_08795 [Tenacibaculum ovolyticum]|uniref:hypothetical protein n=1 Tax=Tenacibaculum ovolyticum TaxID=104270 RepID=UPI0022F3CC18|nr:hypothetical protein [Tenacibaculum ovolyticum]WBX78343.1 hypothetical protein PG911_08795 [Tenacibaculum ovolyticum]